MSELFYDESGRGWSVSEPTSNGGDREFPAAFECIDETMLDKSKSYECECHRRGDDMVVTKVGQES